MATLEDEVFSKMGLLNLEELLNIYSELGLPDIAEEAEKTQANIRRKVVRFLTSDEVVNSDDKGAAHYLVIKTYMDTQDIIVTRTETANVPVAQVVAPTLNTAVNTGVPPTRTAVDPSVAPPPNNGTVKRTVKPDPDLDSASLNDDRNAELHKLHFDDNRTSDLHKLTKYLKKDFKIKGTIGLPGEKDRIKFSQLAHAINRGVRKGYSEEDICEEVIRITSPDIPLREMLEGTEDLTISHLRKILRVHFHEKDSSKLWEELNKATQTASQDATQFTQYLISLKQRILFVSKEAGSSVQSILSLSDPY